MTGTPATILLISPSESPAGAHRSLCAIWRRGSRATTRELPPELSRKVREAARAGIDDQALDEVLRWLETSDGRETTPAPAPPNLTPRELEVLQKLTDGLAYKEIADDLGIRMSTVQSFIRSLYRKLRVHSATEAVSLALRHRWVAA